MLGNYYGSAVEPELLLGRFSPAKVAEAEVRGISTSTSSSLSTIEMVPDIALSSPSVEAEEVNDFEMLWIEGLNADEAEEWKKMSHLFGLTAADLQHQEDGHGAEVEEGDAYPVKWSFAQQVVSDPVEAILFSTATASVTAPPATTPTRVSTSTSTSDDKTQQEALGGDQVEAKNAFFTTDSGLGTLWLHPEKMASLEEATISSFEKLSMR
ncbi:hypothetical protein BGZ97_005404 [Linnemannia gamsii]|uniref:Uncharacterized protein n=1 Tax=Linnemannia gamsii TaxID=64522 RepID=A0A9P6RF96_9FUNG|nr:hypothetical protein BGZ97_005404 [Linnemannia gamsii]